MLGGEVLNRRLGRQACPDKECGVFLTRCAHRGTIIYSTVTLPTKTCWLAELPGLSSDRGHLKKSQVWSKQT